MPCRYRRTRRQQRQDRPPSSAIHRLSHWYDRKPFAPFVTVDQLHAYRRKDFAEPRPCRPPISLSASPSFDTEYSRRYEPPYRTAEEMSVNRRHAAVPRDELQLEGETEFSAEYAERFTDMPRERNVAARQGSHIGPFVCADEAAADGLAFRSEQHDRYVPHPDGRRADNLRPGTGLKVDEAPMDGETEQTANYRKYPVTPLPDPEPEDQTGVITSPTESIRSPTAKRPVDESLKEMILTRDSGMLIGPVRPFQVISGPRTDRTGRVTRRPEFRLEVVDCGDARKAGKTDAFVVLENPKTTWLPLPPPQRLSNANVGGNRWVKRRQRKIGTVRFFDQVGARPQVAGKTVQ